MTRRLLVPLALAACHAHTSAPVDSDTAGAPFETDPALDTRCDASRALAFTAVPDDLGSFPVTWRDQDLTVSTEPFGGSLKAEIVDGCLSLHPGVLRVELARTHCGGASVTARILAACGATCSRLGVFALDTPAGEDRNTKSGAEDVLAVAPATPFTSVRFSTLDARLCGLDLTLAKLPAELATPDTAELF